VALLQKMTCNFRHPMGLHHPVDCCKMLFWAGKYPSPAHKYVGWHVPFTDFDGSVVMCCSVLQYVSVCCGVLQCVAVCCSLLQCAPQTSLQILYRYLMLVWRKYMSVCGFDNSLFFFFLSLFFRLQQFWQQLYQILPKSLDAAVLQCATACCDVLQCVAVCCSVLQCVAVCCSMLQYVAVRCSVLQCVAVCCSVLQYVAVPCSVL